VIDRDHACCPGREVLAGSAFAGGRACRAAPRSAW